MMVELGSSVPLDESPCGTCEYEWRVLTLHRGISCTEAQHLLTEHAEYGEWELTRVLRYMGGSRLVWLRRRIIRMKRTI